MTALKEWFKRYTGPLRDWKGTYILNNWLNRQQLQHNRALYAKYGIRKSILSPVGYGDFAHLQPSGNDIPLIDRPDAKAQLRALPDFQLLDDYLQEKLLRFVDEGYLIWEGFYEAAEADALHHQIETVLDKQQTDFNFTGRKVMNAHVHASRAADHLKHPQLMRVLGMLLGRPVVPFQSINFVEGSEQRAHSDSIHMTTAPAGFLIATWVALEDCDADNGPLFYYPGSHRLPFVSCGDYPAGHSQYWLGAESYPRYEDKVESVIAASGLPRQYFHARKGDLLIWHANLIHGGSAIREAGRTRKSMVCHYYGKDVICYHEITQRPALMPSWAKPAQ